MTRPGLACRVLLLAGVCLAAAPAGAAFPWQPGEAPPPLAGVTLGQSRAEVERVLGTPERTTMLEAEDVVRLQWARKGVDVVVSRLDGAAIVTLTRRDAGAIDGIRVGDSLDAVIQRWGMPQQRVGGDGVWRVGDWDVIVRPATSKPVVTGLTLGWDSSKFAPDAAMRTERDAGRMQLHPLPAR